jgi:hypothetical protein
MHTNKRERIMTHSPTANQKKPEKAGPAGVQAPTEVKQGKYLSFTFLLSSKEGISIISVLSVSVSLR